MESLRRGTFKPTSCGDILGHARDFAFDCDGQMLLCAFLSGAEKGLDGGSTPVAPGPPTEQLGAHCEMLWSELLVASGAVTLCCEAGGAGFVERVLDGIASEPPLFSVKRACEIAQSIGPNILDVALNSVGCRVLQKLIFRLPEGPCQTFAEELRGGGMVKALESCHGNYVVQKIIVGLKGVGASLVLDSLGRDDLSIKHWCSHNFGCRVVQRMLEYSPEAVKAPVLDAIARMAKELIDDTYA
jgi:hypothetical protein